MVFGVAIGRFVEIRAKRVAEIKTIRVGPEGRVDNGDVFLANFRWVVAVVFVKAFLEGVIHGVNGNFTIFVTFHGVEIGFLDEK